MNRSLINNSIAFMIFVCLLANGIAWTFHGEVFTHELDHHHTAYELNNHHHHHHATHEPNHHHDHTPLTQTENIGYHHKNIADDDILDPIIHLSLHAAGQYQQFYLTILPSMSAAVIDKETLAAFIPDFIPESIVDSIFRPPRIFSS